MVETRLGAIVPATEPDFSCCDSLFGGERPCKGRPRPRRRVCFFLTPTEPSLTHCGSRTRETSHARQGTFVQPECIPKPSRKRPLEIQDLSAEEFPESHGDTEKSKLKGKTGAHGGGRGHGEDPRGVQRFSALVVQRGKAASFQRSALSGQLALKPAKH